MKERPVSLQSVRRFIVSCVSAFLPFILMSQQKVLDGIVLSKNGEAVSYAAVGVMGSSAGTVTDPRGKFRLWLPEHFSETDSLKISCVGFQDERFAANSLGHFLNVTLQTKPGQLPEVSVYGLKTDTIEKGNTRINTFLKCNFAISDRPDQNLGAEIGRKFFFKGKKHHLLRLRVHVGLNFDTVLFRLHVYSLKKGLPDSSLLQQNILLMFKGPKIGWEEFDLSSYNLVYDQNIVVALQWVAHSRKGRLVQLPISVPSSGAVHFYKFGSQDKWRRYNNMSTAINLKLAREK